MGEERIVDAVVERLFNRFSQGADPTDSQINNSVVSLPNVIQRIVGNPALPALEGELRSRFNMRPPAQSAQLPPCSSVSSQSSGTAIPVYNPTTAYGRPVRRRKRTFKNEFKVEAPVEKIVYKDFILLPLNVENIPRGKERSRLEKEGFVVHAVPLKHSQTEKEIEDLVNTIFAHKLVESSSGGKRYSMYEKIVLI